MGLRLKTLTFALLLLFSCLSQAQVPQQKSNANGGPRQQLATIIFAGLGGAVLGLSTLSFYGRPQEKLSNIAVGFAIGIIAGATYTTYKAATDPLDRYREVNGSEEEIDLFSGLALESSLEPVQPLGPQLALTWNF